MSLKNSHTTSSYIPWDKMLELVQNLYDDGDYRFSLLILAGSCLGLRISDLRRLTWDELLSETRIIELHEQKTGKYRTLRINDRLHSHAQICHEAAGPAAGSYAFRSRREDKPMNLQYINRRLKVIRDKYGLDCCQNFSTHSLRKTFGRHVYDAAGPDAERALVKLSLAFNHTSPAVTRVYLGLTEEEILSIYDNL